MKLTDYLLSLPCDKTFYCDFIEQLSFGQVIRLNEYERANATDEQIAEVYSEFKMNLPETIRRVYPMLTSIQIEITVGIVIDCVENSIYLDSLFASLNRALNIERGTKSWTDELELNILGCQLN